MTRARHDISGSSTSAQDATGLDVWLSQVETVVGRSLELRIAARTVSRRALSVRLLPPGAAPGVPAAAQHRPHLHVAAAQPVYVQRAGEDAASPLAKGESTLLAPGARALPPPHTPPCPCRTRC